jgi:DNA-directed RNA polymerase subunit RPC12/RpoP
MTRIFRCGIKAKYSGTYRCTSCGFEKTLVKGKRLIACKCGAKEWLLIAYSGKIPDVPAVPPAVQ